MWYMLCFIYFVSDITVLMVMRWQANQKTIALVTDTGHSVHHNVMVSRHLSF